MTGPELERVLLAPWWYGTDPNSGNQHWKNFNGEATEVGGSWGADTGRWYIEADHICFELDHYPPGCSNTYRNPKGTRANSDEYVLELPHGNFPFSAYAERPPALKGE